MERAISKVGVEGRSFLDINITKNSVLCNKESSLTGVYYKMFDIFQEHDKRKTQISLHWMFILFTRLGGLFFPPPIVKQCKQVTHSKNRPPAPRAPFPDPAGLGGRRLPATPPTGFPFGARLSKSTPQSCFLVFPLSNS